MSKYVYGIDLGTTYSCVSYLDENGKAVVIKNKDSDSTTPSVLQLRPGKEPIVGKIAKNTAVFEPDYTLKFIKNVIGRKDEITGEFKKIKYGTNGEEISPVDASAEILKALVAEAGDKMEDTVKDVVITCPAYFNTEQKAATKEAGTRAGLNVLSIIDEPTAAAIAYGQERGVAGQRFLVYDLGGGTFDITVMEITNDGRFKVVCSEGDHDLGGGRWDSVIMDHVIKLWREKFDTDEEMDIESQQDLINRVEETKISLSEKDEYRFVLSTDEGRIQVELTRKLFDDLTKSLLTSTIEITKKAIAVAQGFAVYEENGEKKEKPMDQILAEFDAKYDSSQISKILLVGGSTYMPQVKTAVEEAFKVETIRFQPNEAVAQGAAIYAMMIVRGEELHPTIMPGEEIDSEEISPVANVVVDELCSNLAPEMEQVIVELGDMPVVQTITNKSYGIGCRKVVVDASGHETREKKVKNMITRGMELPCDLSAPFSLAADNMPTVPIAIYESEYYDDYYDPDSTKLCFEKELPIPAGLSKGTNIEVMMSLNAESILKIKVMVGGQELEADTMVQFE